MAFKFNRAWLQEEDYINLIRDIWSEDPADTELTVWDNLQAKMTRIKDATKRWESAKKLALKAELSNITQNICTIYSDMASTPPSEDTFTLLRDLGNRKKEILLMEEITWKLKSRITWLREGDQNTKFFHKLASDRRNRNAIWRIMKLDGTYAISNADIQAEAYRHFSHFYQLQSDINRDNQSWVLDHVQRMFDQDAIDALNSPITREDVYVTLKSFASDRCPGPDGWPSEFYLFFFDLMGNLITEVVEQTRVTGHMLASYNSTFIALFPKST